MDSRVEIGRIEAIFRYPVKSMAGERLESANLGWHGFDGDRRLALRRLDDRNTSGFPWLSASSLPSLLLFAPQRAPDDAKSGNPAYVRTPDGASMPVFGAELAAEIERRLGAAVQMTHLKHGIFDDAPLSVITTDTINEIARLSGTVPDARRFRPNVVVSVRGGSPFGEGDWLGRRLFFGADENAPSIVVTQNDVRCAMVNFDPDTAHATPEVLKSVVAANNNLAGIYGTVSSVGDLAAGQPVFLSAPS